VKSSRQAGELGLNDHAGAICADNHVFVAFALIEVSMHMKAISAKSTSDDDAFAQELLHRFIKNR